MMINKDQTFDFYQVETIFFSTSTASRQKSAPDSIYDTGANISSIRYDELKLIQSTFNDQLIVSTEKSKIMTGDTSEMSGNIGTIILETIILDSRSKRSEKISHQFYVFKKLSSRIIIGKDFTD